MRTPTPPHARATQRMAWSLAMVAGLSACSLPQAPSAKATFDLGPIPSTTQPVTDTPAANKATPRQLRLADTSAPPALASTALTYRLQYAQALEPRAYTLARWSMPPAQLVQQRLRAALAAGGWWLSTDHGPLTPVLHVEVEAFEQVFDSAERSHGRVQWLASLRQGPHTLAQRSFLATAPAPTADATGGAQALAAATTDATSQLTTWLEANTAPAPAPSAENLPPSQRQRP